VKKKSSSAAFVSNKVGLCPPRSWFLLVAPPFLPPFLLSGTVWCDETTGAVACGGWEGLEFGSGLYSPSSTMAGGR
jgi:hypothetical protein